MTSNAKPSAVSRQNALYATARFLSKPVCLTLLAFLSTTVILALVFIRKGFVPFGENGLAYGDAYSQIVPFFNQFLDAVKGGGSLFVDFRTAMGGGSWADAAYYALSPFNLLLLPFPRHAMLDAYLFIIVIKLASASAAAAWVFTRIPKIRPLWVLLLSQLYGLSAYNLAASSFIAWGDAIVLLPLLVCGFYRLLEGGKAWPAVVTLAGTLLFSFYLSTMVMMFVCLAGPLYIIFCLPKEKRGRSAWRFTLAVAAAVGLAAPVLLPVALQLGQSARGTGGLDYLNIIWQPFNPEGWQGKMAVYWGCSLSAAVLWVNRARIKADKRVVFLLSVTAAYGLAVFLEPINLLLHYGSYLGMGFRFAFIPVFLLILASAMLCGGEGEKPGYLMLLWVAPTAFFLVFRVPYNVYDGNLSFYISALTALAFGAVLTSRKRPLFLILLTGAQLLMLSTAYLHNFRPADYRENYKDAMAVGQIIGGGDMTVRALDKGLIFPANNAASSQTSSLARYSSCIPERYLHMMKALGYGSESITVLDSGGSLFTDSLLGGKTLFYERPQESAAYLPAGRVGEHIFLYENTLAFPFGLYVERWEDRAPFSSGDIFANQNDLFAAVSGSDRPLFTTYEFTGDGNTLTCDIEPDRPGIVYLQLTGDTHLSVDVAVNGQPVDTRALSVSHVHPSNRQALSAFTTYSRNGLLLLCETGGQITLTKLRDAAVTARAGVLDLPLLADFRATASSPASATASGNTITLETDGTNRQTLFLPLSYDKGWRCTADGAKIPVQPAFGSFTVISLPENTNTVKLVYRPPGWQAAAAIAFLTLLLSAACWIWKPRQSKLCEEIALRILYVLCGGVVLLLFAVPAGAALLRLILTR